jgi:pimeloyl-ACP methyl ester carboxylesterase
VFAPDLPRGRAIGELADWLAGWTDDAHVGPAVCIANSMGCQVAVEHAVRRPERVSALVLVGPTVDPRARTLVEQGVRLARDAVSEPPALIWTVATDYARSGPLRTVRWARRMLEHRIEDRLPLVAAPTLVVRGERDAIVPREWAQRVASLVPDGEFAEIPGAAHATHFTHPEEVRALANELLTRSKQQAG